MSDSVFLHPDLPRMIDANAFHTLIIDSGRYIWVETAYAPYFYQGAFRFPSGGVNAWSSTFSYDIDSASWIQDNAARPFYFSSSQLLAQDWSDSVAHYLSTDQLYSYSVPAPAGSVFDSIYVYSPVNEVVNLLPVAVPVLILFLGIRKALAFLRRIVSSA